MIKQIATKRKMFRRMYHVRLNVMTICRRCLCSVFPQSQLQLWAVLFYLQVSVRLEHKYGYNAPNWHCQVQLQYLRWSIRCDWFESVSFQNCRFYLQFSLESGYSFLDCLHRFCQNELLLSVGSRSWEVLAVPIFGPNSRKLVNL